MLLCLLHEPQISCHHDFKSAGPLFLRLQNKYLPGLSQLRNAHPAQEIIF